MKIIDFAPREYQKEILETCKESSCLVVLPTGLGKTAISLLLASHRLNIYKDSKILLCSPTKPLCNQHLQTFKKHTDLESEKITLLTGALKPEERKNHYINAKIIIATPQTIQKDLENKRISLENFSLLCIDEAHKSRENFANTIIAKEYSKTSKFPLILGLTASPGGTKTRIKEICRNLNIEKVEIRTEHDKDIKPYVQEKGIQWIPVELTPKLKEIHSSIKLLYKVKLKGLKKLGFTKPLSLVNKMDLLTLQTTLRREINKKNFIAYYGISLVAQLLKLNHCLELLETQGIEPLNDFFNKLKNETTKASKAILNDKKFSEAVNEVNELINKGVKHPKLEILIKIIKYELGNNSGAKFIIFANFRSTINIIIKNLKAVENIRPVMLIGQKEGLSQKQQIQNIRDFESGTYNCLCCTSIGEEGINISGGAELAIFYDSVSSEIRSIQRTGRVGRIKPGKIIFLMTKNSRDEAYYFSAKRKERIMRKTLHNLQNPRSEQTKLA